VTECDRWGEGVKKIRKSADVVYGRPLSYVVPEVTTKKCGHTVKLIPGVN